jgi:hypothetical protein
MSNISDNLFLGSNIESNQFISAYNDVFRKELIYNDISDNQDQSENYKQLYLTSENSKTTTETLTVKNKNKNIFEILTENAIILHKNEKKSRMGRKTNSEKKEETYKKKIAKKQIHDKNDKFNILNASQHHAMNCLYGYINKALDFIGFKKNERFCKITSSEIKKVDNKSFSEMKKKKLFEILTSDISPKYTKIKKDHNYNLYQKIKIDPSCEVIVNILNETYLSFFQNVYYKSKRIINLHKDGVDGVDSFTLSPEIELYEDKINTLKKEGDKDYLQNYQNYINICYFGGKLKFFLE